jgi:hypothetical protein
MKIEWPLAHGRLDCRVCWEDRVQYEKGRWKGTNFHLHANPCAWGNPEPRYFVLGLSKGQTQTEALDDRTPFDKVAFMGMRPRLLEVLQAVGLPITDIDALMQADQQDYAVGSVVRCSLTARTVPEGPFRSESAKVLPAFSEGSEVIDVVRQCMRTFLVNLPPRLQLIVLLGNSDKYMEYMSREVKRLYQQDFYALDKYKVAYAAGGKHWVHVAHPSGANGHFDDFIKGPEDKGQGLKRRLAKEAVAPFL